MNRNNFDQLLDKYLLGVCSPEEKKLVEQWYTLLDNQDLQLPQHSEAIKNKIWNKLQEETQPIIKHNPKVISIWRVSILKYAATIALLIVNALYFYNRQYTTLNTAITVTKGIKLLKQKNTGDKILSLILNDSSQVNLEPNAELIYPNVFGTDKREVELIGEAFFRIEKKPSHPFLVHANGTITKVLGTSFRVNSNDKAKSVIVSVQTGKVSVFTIPIDKKYDAMDPEKRGVVLTPNQEVIVNLKTRELHKTLIEKPQILVPLSITKDLIFEDAPVTTIFDAMEKAYGIDIVFDEDVLKNCTLTTSLTDETMFDKLKIICRAINATYKEIDAQIVISSKGCL